ncbi:2,3-bisphosphoglycerate-dependent phosphoglycerate mutase [Streptomyces lanatus]|uniref:2,3-bisphosphoglycerate-dependent phosphoglycerate mutase n=1 Tax=Streptomyces lanatus TaxID=66900 RepID=A0ABV1XLB4_9ACTN|nr:2,3-bisphosphoglycerate-dependent phosphoglycerate mutase [Streptomyces lanatus]GHG98754.1 2,3-bisphosphoglycerate-dependent phosphoglycerate mutase [Streptomyces lanatus]
MRTLILLRHGESDWNSKNLFTGWIDVDLTAHGEEQALLGGKALAAAGLLPTRVHTSVLTRAVRTGTLAMEGAGHPWVPTDRHWRLNERHYGALQGREKAAVLREFGEDQFHLWRRSYDAAPPPVAEGSPGDVSSDPRYSGLPRDLLPRTESLADVTARLLPYWHDAIVPDLRPGHTVLVVAHSNSLRALVAHLDRLTREELLTLNIPTGMPLRYDLGEDLVPLVRGGRYLDLDAAAAAAAEVADQGGGRLGSCR